MDILLASANKHKVRELRMIFDGHRIMTPAELGVVFEYEETGNTFFANAYGKAMAFFELLQWQCAHSDIPDPAADDTMVIADDSGLCVDALDGGPGVHSARFGADEGASSDEERTELLLRKLEGARKRQAHYVCCMVGIRGVDRWFCAQETWHGEIALERSSGKSGFGYDPVFLLPDRGVTVADISDAEKHALSHRGKAARVMNAMFY
ncbi:MAG: non-canonical purine NTP pyrophosphatase [Spirochaetaceae bacterium]|nr:MAG: non-canonical purine NTP pyrophosphatase [Spirochaetaceae bacterium]